MKRMQKDAEIMIPHWPRATDPAERIGTRDYGNSGCGVDSFWLALRASEVDPKIYMPDSVKRSWQDIGFNVFVHKDGKVGVEFKAHDVYSAGLRHLEALIKNLKLVYKRVEGLEWTTLDAMPYTLMDMCQRLGIEKCVQYCSGPDMIQPVSLVIKDIVAEATRRHGRMQ